MENYTTIEQSKKLLKLGLNSETADCNWEHAPGYENHEGNITGFWDDPEWGQSCDSKDLPCWSFGALLKIIPNYQLQTQSKGFGILFSCRKELKIIEANTPFEAAYNMVCWLLETGYIKN